MKLDTFYGTNEHSNHYNCVLELTEMYVKFMDNASFSVINSIIVINKLY